MKRKLKKIHIGAVVLLTAYFVIGNSLLAIYAQREDVLEAFFVSFLYGSVACVVFLYIFSHESFFSFSKDLEKGQMNKERRVLSHFKHTGKKAIAVIATTIGGPILGALTIRLLLNTMRNKYLFLILANIPSTIFTVGTVRGAFSFFG